jgi:UDP-glucose 4-epimerase
MGSRGSVIPLFINQVMSGKSITVTDPNMTRFMMTLDDAVNLVLYAFEHGKNGDIFVQKAPAATVEVLIQAILSLMNKPGHIVEIIGTRHGEKLYESLLSREERSSAEELPNYFRVSADTRDLNYGIYVEHGEPNITTASEYTSHNTYRLDVDGMKNLLLKLEPVKKLVQGEVSTFWE